MNPLAVSALAIAAAYLIGGIPFGFLTARWVRGIDIRTVGSGNIGATNVGRVLGFRYFVLVFALDVLKGLLPTLYFPALAARWSGRPIPWLGVAVALATILGHNYPIYLRLRGGKGVATSFGALLALDWVASLASVGGFAVCLAITCYVSASSITGGIFFLVTYFLRTPDPWNGDHIAMTVLTIALVVLLIARHRANLVRIAAGSEPKVRFCKPKAEPPRGSVSWAFVLAVVVVVAALGIGFALNATRKTELIIGATRVAEVARIGTGHQRAERLAFLPGGRTLAVACPRYNRVVIYRVTERESFELASDVALEGRPVAVVAASDRFYVLERPAGDARHLEPGWWEAIGADGRRIGSKFRVGFDPDDMAILPDGRHAVVLLSGHAEGETNRPDPSLNVVALGDEPGLPKVIGSLTFDKPGDDPSQLNVSASGRSAAVSLLGTNQVAAISLADSMKPTLIGRSKLPDLDVPYPSEGNGDSILMPVASEAESALVNLPLSGPCVAAVDPHRSRLVFYEPEKGRNLGSLRLQAPMNLGVVRPTGLAYSRERGLLAVANRSGGVHLIAIRSRESESPQDLAAADKPARR